MSSHICDEGRTDCRRRKDWLCAEVWHGGLRASIPSHHAVRTRHESNAAHGRTRDHQADQPASTCA